MKISFIIQDLFQQGAQYVTALMIRGFIAKGYDVDLVVSKVHADLKKRGDIKPFEIPIETNVTVLPSRKARNNVKAIQKYLLVNQPDAIVAMSSNYTIALALATLLLPGKVKHKCVFAYVEHSGFVGFDLKTMMPARSRHFSIEWFRSLFLKKSYNVIMGVSKGTSKALEHHMRCRPNYVVPVYNPVIDDLYWKKLAEAPSHPWIKNKDITTIVAAGAHCEIKNHKCLFEALKLANERVPVRLILFGKGELTDCYQKWINDHNMSDKITLAGHTSNLPAEIHGADAFIISSDLESFSVVLVEALAARVPVISTNCMYGPPELLQNGKFGTLVPTNNPQALADAIISQVLHPKVAAPKESWEPFTVENIVNVYENALGISNTH